MVSFLWNMYFYRFNRLLFNYSDVIFMCLGLGVRFMIVVFIFLVFFMRILMDVSYFNFK